MYYDQYMPCNNPYNPCAPMMSDYMYDQDMLMPYTCGQAYPYGMMAKDTKKKCVKVSEVVGRNHCQILLEQELPFAPGYPALAIKDIQKEVKELITTVCKDKVLINGKLHKNINYKTLCDIGSFKCNCEELEVLYGDVRHLSVDLPFAGYVEVPGARPGDTIEVEFAGVEECCEIDILKDPYYMRGCEIPLYKKLKEKVVIKIDLKVLRPVQITVDPECPNMCP